MNSRHTLIAGVFVLALGGATPTWSQPVTIANAPNPPADAVAIPAGSRERAVQELPRVVAEIMKRSQVPGMAVAVVVDGKTVLTQGYGTREVGKQAPVDAHTVFQIASISKSLSATVAAIEVSQGKAAWDDPVSRYLPDFKLGNAYVSEHATIGDYFAHRSGLPGTAGDDLEDLGFSRNEVLARLRLLPLDAFRTSYHYANFSTTIGAEAVAKAAGRPWEALADEQLFKPLGMKSTSYRYRDFEAHTNRAVLHAYQNGRFVPAGQRDADQQAPAGGVSSTVVDLAEWLKLLLADGQYQGKAMISPAALLPALSPQAFSARAHDLDSRSGFYGYGFNVNTELGGRPSMGHSGAFLMGTGTTFRIVPSAGIGIVVLTNGAPVGAAESVAASFIDTALYGKPTRDWFAAYNGAMKAFFEPQADLSGQADPARPAAPQALSQYTGRFDNPYYGPAEIQEANGALTLVLGPKGMRFPMRHWDGDTFAFSPAGEAELVASLASLSFGKSQGQVQDFDIKFYGDNGLGRWTRK
ncbi:D-alanyl-D-alanine-carboxypeptidase/endopeptidaseAmpH precursor [Achromobacter insolitus]|uniref:serine hydrolase n=1 Tax=Achromobacter insolitus TaxID=217204 RepID=UPI00097297F2|nr:serine hydrolase [Achromobacter insolitus]APX76157.1 serine hydrolase [Achromobacter insolitus]OWT57868.1 serine hydrolase [Achromobacter insolitus]CAB3724081.1 D-aminopeptidase [Achromobacter insolitus]VEG66538.1 D-alanyl-D-alanine-carboxypeptidase/endopeptidaseAmpH precursor [Achromobacter insolitus]